MEQKKILVVLLLGLTLVSLSSATCTESEIGACTSTFVQDLSSAGITFEYPVPNIATNQLSDFCSKATALTTCLNTYRADCTFARKNEYAPMEDVSKFICDDTSAYQSHQSDISISATRTQWQGCFTTGAVTVFNDNPTTDNTVGCATLTTFVTCMGLTAKTAGGAELETYITNMAYKALTVYDEQYGCGLGGSAGRIAGMTFLQILCLIILVWARM